MEDGCIAPLLLEGPTPELFMPLERLANSSLSAAPIVMSNSSMEITAHPVRERWIAEF
jgi:hypothetical protein